MRLTTPRRVSRPGHLRTIILTVGALAAAGYSKPGRGVPAGETQAPDLVRVAQGHVAGRIHDAVVQFYGIPYAAPPVGERRWAPPSPPAAWEGARDATKPRMACSQGAPDPRNPPNANEDCLWVNITAPAARANLLPVMVWLHGGGLQAGSANDYDPSRMAATGNAIVVTVESRINIMGYFGLPGLAGSGTFGLQDEQAALRWVRGNIAAFGGDPRNVTLFGESGVAARTCAHLTSPGSAGFFEKAIMESGGCSMSWAVQMTPFGSFWAPEAEIAAQGRDLATKLGCKGDDAAQLACLRRVPAATLVTAGSAMFGQAAFGTPTLPLQPMMALEAGRFASVPVLSGTNRDEGRAFVSLLRFAKMPMTASGYATILRQAFGAYADAVHARYPEAAFVPHPDAPALAWASVITDRMFACPQLNDMRLIAAKAPVYGYRFDDPHGIGLVPFPPDFPPGASHSGELPLLFDLTGNAPFDITTGKKIMPSPPQQRLARTMIEYWTAFARRSDPNSDGLPAWPRFGSDDRVLALAPSPGKIASLNSYAAHQCAFWRSFIDAGAASR